MKYQNWHTLWHDTGLRPRPFLGRDIDAWLHRGWSTGSPRSETTQPAPFSPACDFTEEQDHFLLTVEMPGVSPQEVTLEAIENQLILSGERRQDRNNQGGGAWYSERHYGKFQRTFGLPAGVDTHKLAAHHENGVLQIFIPKAESAKPRQIQIEVGRGGSSFTKPIRQAHFTRKEERTSSFEHDPEKVMS